MPNWSCGRVTVKGEPEDVKKFCEYFNYEDDTYRDDLRKKCFARSFVHQDWTSFVEDYNLGESNDVEFNVDFAWSAHSCLIEGYPQDNKRNCITLATACKRHNVKVDITTEEPGMGFEEHIVADRNNVLSTSTQMPTFTCVCGASQCISKDTDIIDIECCSCDKSGEGKIK